MPLLMFIEAQEPPGNDGDAAREPWLLEAVDWLFPWPAAIVWLCLASRYADGWLGVALIFAATGLAAWRAFEALPSGDGLEQDRQ